jgi:hypothetical protein
VTKVLAALASSCKAQERSNQAQENYTFHLGASGCFTQQPRSVGFAIALQQSVSPSLLQRQREPLHDVRPLIQCCASDLCDGATLSELCEADNLFAIRGQVRNVTIGQLNAPMFPHASQLGARNDSNGMGVEEQEDLLMSLSVSEQSAVPPMPARGQAWGGNSVYLPFDLLAPAFWVSADAATDLTGADVRGLLTQQLGGSRGHAGGRMFVRRFFGGHEIFLISSRKGGKTGARSC